MQEQPSVMQCRCACAVDAVRLGLSGFRKVARLHGPKPCHESFDGLYLFEIKYTPAHEGPRGNDWRSWLGGASAHSRHILAKNCSGLWWQVQWL